MDGGRRWALASTTYTALAKADQPWLERLITRRVPLGRWPEALQRRPDDVKVVLDLAA